MRIKVFGFGFSGNNRPQAISPIEIYHSLSQTCNLSQEKELRYAVGNYRIRIGNVQQNWWAGILIKVKDQQNFTKLTRSTNGETRITAAALGIDEKIAETSFFLANPTTGNGLYAAHYRACPLAGGFLSLLHRCFKQIQEDRKQELNQDATLSPQERKTKNRRLSGNIIPTVLVMGSEFHEAVAALRQVKDVELTLASATVSTSLFGARAISVEKERVKMKLAEHTIPMELGDALFEKLNDESLEKAIVHGIDSNGIERGIKSAPNRLIFADIDYDEQMSDFVLDEHDIGTSLQNARLLGTLSGMLQNTEIENLLQQNII